MARRRFTFVPWQGLSLLFAHGLGYCVEQTSFALPRTGATFYTNMDTEQKVELASRFQVVVLGMHKTMGKAKMQKVIDDIRARNSAIQLAQYTVLNESYRTTSPRHDSFKQVQVINANNWWARAASGKFVQWTSAYNAFEVNLTSWVSPDTKGRQWPQWKAQYEASGFFNQLTGLDYVFVDNLFWRPRVGADWKRNGTNQSKDDPSIQTEYRKGYLNYMEELRRLSPHMKLLANTDNDLNFPEFKHKLEGAFLEGMIGRSWSIETRGGWLSMMQRYRSVLKNTIQPKLVLFQVGTNHIDMPLARYGMASALLEDGYFAYTLKSQQEPPLLDEYSAPLGTASEPPPRVATTSGIWLRRYANGMVLVNPSKTASATWNIGPGYKRLRGSQDPEVNSGKAVSSVMLGPRSGLLLIKDGSNH